MAGGCERWAACGRRLCAATPWMMGRARLEAIRGGPVDDGRARLEAVRGGPVDDGRARLRPCAADPRMIGRVRLEAMRDWSLCTVSKFGVLAVHHFRRLKHQQNGACERIVHKLLQRQINRAQPPIAHKLNAGPGSSVSGASRLRSTSRNSPSTGPSAPWARPSTEHTPGSPDTRPAASRDRPSTEHISQLTGPKSSAFEISPLAEEADMDDGACT